MKRPIITPAQRQLEDRLIQEWLEHHQPTRCRPGRGTGQSVAEMLDSAERLRKARVSRGRKKRLTE